MPSTLDHAAICRMIDNGELAVATEPLADETSISLSDEPGDPLVVPVLISSAKKHHIATEGHRLAEKDATLFMLRGRDASAQPGK